MSGNPYETPQSNLQVEDRPPLSPVKRPRTRWLIGLLAFLTFGLFANGISGLVAAHVGRDEAFAQQIAAILLIANLVLVFGVITLNKTLSLAAALLLFSIALYQSLRLGVMLMDGADIRSLALVFWLYIAIPFLCAWYIARPAYRQTLNMVKRYNEAQSMHKYVSHQLRKGRRLG